MDDNPYRSPQSESKCDKPEGATSGSISWFYMAMFGCSAWAALLCGMLLLMSRQLNSVLMAGVALGGYGAVYAWQRVRR